MNCAGVPCGGAATNSTSIICTGDTRALYGADKACYGDGGSNLGDCGCGAGTDAFQKDWICEGGSDPCVISPGAVNSSFSCMGINSWHFSQA
ncbi:MAG: hypothetical protein IPJ88_03855 [Myxococcales bacterium]|nr:MAG: hypothetical protein IPJ88_03855 [Myxococcales bacterium]